MMRPMRRKDRFATEEETLEMLNEGIYGVLSVCGNDNMPYGVPLNYAYANGAIYFHCAKTGHKLDIMNENNNVCFTVVTKSDVLANIFSSDFKSAVVFGKSYLVEDEKERQFAFEAILHKYCSDFIPSGMEHIRKAGPAALIYKVIPEEMSGKLRRMI